MGYSTRPGTKIQDFWPDDTDTEMYIQSDSVSSLQDLLDRAREKWPDASMGQIRITAEEIHTACLGYDLYDPIDYTDFIILTKS